LSTTSALWNAPGGTVFPKKQELRSYRQTKMAGQLNQNRPAKQAWSWAKFNFLKSTFQEKIRNLLEEDKFLHHDFF
jgi:hypothetical protein